MQPAHSLAPGEAVAKMRHFAGKVDAAAFNALERLATTGELERTSEMER